jgi:hypothetical protein
MSTLSQKNPCYHQIPLAFKSISKVNITKGSNDEKTSSVPLSFVNLTCSCVGYKNIPAVYLKAYFRDMFVFFIHLQ